MESNTPSCTDQPVREQIRQIKASLRLFMNGMTSQSMREKGLSYKLNFGIELARLKEIASGYQQDRCLAQELWKEDIRECRILATMLYPALEMDMDLAELWIEQMPSTEVARICVLYLFSKLSFAPQLALRSIASDDRMAQVCGYSIIARLLQQRPDLPAAAENEILDQSIAAAMGDDTEIAQSAWAVLRVYMRSSQDHAYALCRRCDGIHEDDGPVYAGFLMRLRAELESLE